MDDEKELKNEENRAKIVQKQTNKENSKKHRIRWTTKTIAEGLDREELLRITFQEFLVYLVFLILVTIFITGLRNRFVFYLTKGLSSQFTERSFKTIGDAEINFDGVASAADFWSVKMNDSSCVIHTHFRRLFLKCFDSYSTENEDKETFGSGTETAWVYSEQSVTNSLPFTGSISRYGGGGFYVDLKKIKNDTIDIIKELKDNLWVTRGTRAIFIDFSVYNANVNIFGICKLLFEFPTIGGVIPSAHIRSLKLIRLHRSYDYFILVCEIVFYCFILFYLLEEIREIIYFRLQYFRQFWNYVDLIIITFSVAGGLISAVVWIKEDPALEAIKENPDKYGNLEAIGNLNIIKMDLFAIDLFFIYVKLFKYLNFNRTMAQLNNTLSRCVWDILGFSIMFFIIFIAYAILGYLLFGSKIESFSYFGTAMFTLLRTILGDFDYSALEKANRYLAPVYFLSYIFLVFFVLLNMFLAIINDTYADVKTEIAITPDELQMSQYLKRLFNAFLLKCGCGKCIGRLQPDTKTELNVTIKQIRETLAKCGFNDLEIEMFFSRYNINPTAEIRKQDTEKLSTELENILRDSTEAEKTRYVKIDDFLEQQKKLEEIDKTIRLLVEKVKTLLSKLQQMDNVKKVKQGEKDKTANL